MINIRKTQHDDISCILDIATDVFGPNYLLPDHIPQDSQNATCVVACLDEKIIGFGFAKFLNHLDFSKIFAARNIPYGLEKASQDGHLGIIKTLAVSKNIQGKGIGFQIFKELENNIREKGAIKIIVPAWRIKNKINLEKILSRLRYKPFLEINDMWKKDCDDGKFNCVSRSDECVCSLVYFQDSK